jgi:hypothetical protein
MIHDPLGNPVFIFIDEAGELGFGPKSCRNLVLGFASFPDTTYKQCVDTVKDVVKQRVGRPPKELKFNKAESNIRYALLGHMMNCNGKFGYIYVDKSKIHSHLRPHPQINFTYNQMVFWLVENIVYNAKLDKQNVDLVIHIDQRSKKKEINNKLTTYVTQNINPIIHPNRVYINPEKSHKSRGLQCADFVCGSVYQRVENNDNSYFDTIRKNMVVRRQLFRRGPSVRY